MPGKGCRAPLSFTRVALRTRGGGDLGVPALVAVRTDRLWKWECLMLLLVQRGHQREEKLCGTELRCEPCETLRLVLESAAPGGSVSALVF